MSADGPNTNPGPHERECFNCGHRVWAVPLGLGALCRHPANGRDGRLLRVPNRRHTCGYFEGGPDYVDPPAVVVRRPEDRGDPDHRGGTA